MSIRLSVFLATSFGFLTAQEWTRVVFPGARPAGRHAPFVHDAARGRSILFGGTTDSVPGPQTVPLDEQWEFDGRGWALAQPRVRPAARYFHSMAYDSLRQRVLLFGGRSVPYVDRDDLWSFDGVTWTQLSPATSPPARRSAAMTHDSARDRVVLFGGVGAVYHDDTWEFDGTTWQQIAASGPTARDGAGLAYDPLRGVCVMSGGYNPGIGGLDTTWEYDGTAWTLRAAQRTSGQLCFDANVGRVVSPFGEWDGTAWLPQNAVGSPQLVFDPVAGRRIAVGGQNSELVASTFEGGAWRSQTTVVEGRALHDPVRNRLLWFGTFPGGGTTNVWRRSQLGWEPVVNGSYFVGIQQPLRVFDTARDELHTMSSVGSSVGALVIQRGSDFQFLQSVVCPFGSTAQIAYDAARGRTIAVYTQTGGPGVPAEMQTWEWDGTTWQENTSSPQPPLRLNFGVAYDAARAKVVLTGGFWFPPGAYTDTWELDANGWTQVPTPTPAPAGTWNLAYDAGRQRTVALRGTATWEYDGIDWTQLATSVGPQPETLGDYDPARGRLLAFGSGARCCFFELGPSPAASFSSFGAGCATSVAPLDLAAEASPLLGFSVPVRLRGLPPEPGIALAITGFDDQTYNGTPLPIGLGPVGAPSACELAIAPAVIDLAAHVGTTARFVFSLPSSPALLGAVYFQQGAVLDDLLGTPLPLATSNALRFVAGL